MTPPRKPGHETTGADEIVDLTPAYTPEEDAQEIVDLTPAYTPEEESEEQVDSTPAYAPEGQVLEYVPDGQVQELDETTATYAQNGKPDRRVAKAPPPTATPRPEPEEQAANRPKAGANRWKRIMVAVAGIAVVAFLGKTVGQAIGSGAINPNGGHKTSQATATAPAGTPTPSAAQIGNNTISTAPGPLILLNPGVVRQGTGVGVTGSGFDPGAVIDLTITRQGTPKALATTFVQADKGGTFADATLTVPTSLSAGNFIVEARERNSKNVAQAVGTVAGGAPTVKLGTQVGKPGDVIVLSLNGFAPGETVNVYWNTLTGQPVTTFKADGGGGIGQAKIQVPFGAVGNNTFLFVGANSQSLVAANFLVLQLYPTIKLGSYALQADNVMSFSGSGFGPGERVFVFLNNTKGQPLAVVNSDATGSFKNAPGFVVPFAISGKQTLIFMGEQSRAPNAVSFTVLPYTPVVQASTYGGLPGMTITFYGTGFARNEVVHVYAGHTKSTMGTMVSCFQADGKGAAASAGSYVIPGNAQGTVGFALVGAKSGGVGVASVNISPPPSPVQTPPQAPFTCPLDPPTPQAQSPQAPQAPPPAAPQQPAATPVPNAPQGNLAPSSTSIAPRPVAYVPASTGHIGALLRVTAAPQPSAAHVSAATGQQRVTDPAANLPSSVWSDIQAKMPISSLLVALLLAWLLMALVLTINVMCRSAGDEEPDFEHAAGNDAVPESPPAALLTTTNALVAGSDDDDTVPSPAAADRGSRFIETRAQPPAAGPPYQLSGAANLALSPARRWNPRPTLHAARCTATPQGDGGQPSHDATFVRTNVKLVHGGTTYGETAIGLFLVADGSSGAGPGAAASQAVLQHIATRVITAMSNDPEIPSHVIRLLFKCAVMQASNALVAQNATHCTDAIATVTGALVAGERAYIVNIGDCRTYVCGAEGGLRQITKDHSVGSGMARDGPVGPRAVDASRRAQQLYRSLGDADQLVQVDTFVISLGPGDRLLLCSDGLWRQIRDAQIEAILRGVGDPDEATRALIRTAGQVGSDDDISAVVVQVLDGGALGEPPGG